jgi:dihydrodipicolinate synthase/N-acetylneuraminate lyase
MSEPFHGVLPALITPFTADGDAIDAQALARIVDRLVGAGVGGLVPGGSTGEFTTLTNAERRRLVEVTVEAAGGRVPVVAGTGALSTRETVELSVHAEQAGAAAVMIVPPFYDAPTWPELLAHYTAVADAIEIPIMYYNLPSASGVRLSAAQLRELPVTCLKDTGGDAVAATELRPTARRCSTAGTRSPSPRSPPASAPSSGASPRSSRSRASSCTGS